MRIFVFLTVLTACFAPALLRADEPAKEQPVAENKPAEKTPADGKAAAEKPAEAPAADAEKPADANEPTEEQIRFFETRVRPVLAQHCFDCHGEDSQESDLRLDTAEGVFRGGKGGPAVFAKKPDSSLLITAVRYQDHTLQMPPDGKLSAKEVADLTEWVKMGAPWPGAKITNLIKPSFNVEEARQFWSFQQPVDHAPPAVKDTAWPQSPLDHFILAKLEEKGLKPATATDKRTLLRRVTFDLTGLPPTPAEMDAFLADESPEAFARVVDRLLASPAYGERWGRHWLDVARYADSNGLDENVAHGNAWRYRDWVISAFNDDKPYNEFVVEQIAGDLLPADDYRERNQQVIATGFLSLGPKVLAEVDKMKMEMDIIDEQVDTLGRAMMGLTFGCARCHDHKFDPILTSDYYALAGIFKSTKTMESFKTIARWNETPVASPEQLAEKAEHDKHVAAKKTVIDEFVKTANAELQAKLGESAALPKNPEKQYPAEKQAELKKLKEELTVLEKAAPKLPSAMSVTEGAVTDIAVHIRGSHLTLGEMAPRRFPVVLAGLEQPAFDASRSGRLKLAEWMTQPDHPLTPRVMANRIWRWHFGQGIVRTVDNFGILSEPPTHPELLDWLALRLIENNWSIKAMHRLVLLSSTYQMSSQSDPKAVALDPDNFLHWRHDLRRLEAEELRDAMLAVAGRLDRTMGGTLLSTENYKHIFDHTSKDGTTYDTDRRSVYVPIVRNNLYDVFQLFDFADANTVTGHRPTSTVAPQALFLLNSPLVISVADTLATEMLGRADLDDAGRIGELYRRICGRPVTADETAQGVDFLASFRKAVEANQPEAAEREKLAWSALSQVLLASNEFNYIR